jgi:uncharacterized protein YndB with AHSA1/START domain
MYSLEVRRTIKATAKSLFEAWTQPEYLRQWWGPRDVVCNYAEVDLKEGGTYRISNQFPDGKVLWITGTFEVIVPPKKLIYSWSMDEDSVHNQRVTVQFEEQNEIETEVIIYHERIETRESQESHNNGWNQCLDGLTQHLG